MKKKNPKNQALTIGAFEQYMVKHMASTERRFLVLEERMDRMEDKLNKIYDMMDAFLRRLEVNEREVLFWGVQEKRLENERIVPLEKRVAQIENQLKSP